MCALSDRMQIRPYSEWLIENDFWSNWLGTMSKHIDFDMGRTISVVDIESKGSDGEPIFLSLRPLGIIRFSWVSPVSTTSIEQMPIFFSIYRDECNLFCHCPNRISL